MLGRFSDFRDKFIDIDGFVDGFCNPGSQHTSALLIVQIQDAASMPLPLVPAHVSEEKLWGHSRTCTRQGWHAPTRILVHDPKSDSTAL